MNDSETRTLNLCDEPIESIGLGPSLGVRVYGTEEGNMEYWICVGKHPHTEVTVYSTRSAFYLGLIALGQGTEGFRLSHHYGPDSELRR